MIAFIREGELKCSEHLHKRKQVNSGILKQKIGSTLKITNVRILTGVLIFFLEG